MMKGQIAGLMKQAQQMQQMVEAAEPVSKAVKNIADANKAGNVF